MAENNVSEPDMIEAIESLQNTHNNIKVFTVVPMGVLMILYFFSYATLIDHGMYGMLGFEIISTILFFAAIIFINRFSFVILKMRYKNKPPYADMLRYLNYADMAARADKISDVVQSRRARSM